MEADFGQAGGMTTPMLPFDVAPQPSFDGVTFDPVQDAERLSKQLDRVKRCMADGRSHTLRELESLTGYPQASISARLRDLRKTKHGGHIVERQRVTGGLYSYRVITG